MKRDLLNLKNVISFSNLLKQKEKIYAEIIKNIFKNLDHPKKRFYLSAVVVMRDAFVEKDIQAIIDEQATVALFIIIIL